MLEDLVCVCPDILTLMMQSWVGKLPDYPHPVASRISSRMMVELAVVTATMAAAAVVVGGFLASAVFAVTSFVFLTVSYVVWPISRPFLKLSLGLIFGIFERFWDNVVDFFGAGGIFSKFYEVYTFGGVSASIEMLKPIMIVLLTMVLLVRFTLSRRPKNFRKWVCPFQTIFSICVIVFLPRTTLHLLQLFLVKNNITSFLILSQDLRRSKTKRKNLSF